MQNLSASYGVIVVDWLLHYELKVEEFEIQILHYRRCLNDTLVLQKITHLVLVHLI